MVKTTTKGTGTFVVVFALGGGGWKVSLPAARSKNSTLLKNSKMLKELKGAQKTQGRAPLSFLYCLDL
jgi:hypothetical protein